MAEGTPHGDARPGRTPRRASPNVQKPVYDYLTLPTSRFQCLGEETAYVIGAGAERSSAVRGKRRHRTRRSLFSALPAVQAATLGSDDFQAWESRKVRAIERADSIHPVCRQGSNSPAGLEPGFGVRQLAAAFQPRACSRLTARGPYSAPAGSAHRLPT